MLSIYNLICNGYQVLVSKAMAKSANDYYSSVGEFAQDVQDLVLGRWF